MTSVAGFPDRDGLKKLITLAKAMCVTVATFSAILTRKYPGNETIVALLAAIAAVCALIPDLENEFLIPGGDNDPVLDDPAGTPGIDPSAPPAASPTLT
ncbi:MAG TPA: hypothetical protein V6C65_41165 [Allocoleopsis sp.]